MRALAFVAGLPGRANRAFEGWLTAPEVNAAGRMGLFRILYGLFLLWHAGQGYTIMMAQMPPASWTPIFVLRSFKQTAPSPLFYHALEFVLILCVVLLIVGYHVRLMTGLVLICAFLNEALRFSYGRIEHGSVFMVLFIPLFMLLSQWGATYSLDAVLKARRTGESASPSDSSWRYIWPMRVILVVLSFLFVSAGYWKWNRTGWVKNPAVFANVLLKENIEVTTKGGFASPLLVIFAQMPLMTTFLRFATLTFEPGFFVALFSSKLRNWVVCIALIFHSINALLMYVSFSYLLIVYGLFVDWQHYYERWWPARFKRLSLERLPSPALVVGVPVVAAVFALLWTATPYVRPIFTLGGLIDWRTIWWIVLPFAIIGFIRSSWALIAATRAMLRRAPIRRGILSEV